MLFHPDPTFADLVTVSNNPGFNGVLVPGIDANVGVGGLDAQVRIGGDRISLRPFLGAGGKNHSNGYSHDGKQCSSRGSCRHQILRRADTLSPSLLDGITANG